MLQILNAQPVLKAVLNPAGRAGGIVHVLIAGRKLEKNLLTSIQSMFCFVSIAARHASSLFRAESSLSCKGEVPPMLASEEGSGVSFFRALQAAGGGCGQCLPLAGSGITALNCLILEEKGVNGTLHEKFQCLWYHRSCYLVTVTGCTRDITCGALAHPILCCWAAPRPQAGSVRRHELARVSGGKAYELCKTQRRCRIYSCEIFPVN